MPEIEIIAPTDPKSAFTATIQILQESNRPFKLVAPLINFYHQLISQQEVPKEAEAEKVST